jgi:hypothetical protein
LEVPAPGEFDDIVAEIESFPAHVDASDASDAV